MIDYDDLRKKATAIIPDDDGNYDFDELYLRGEVPDEIADYIEAMTPATTLRLLEIIRVAKEGLGIAIDNAGSMEVYRQLRGAIDAIAKIENE